METIWCTERMDVRSADRDYINGIHQERSVHNHNVLKCKRGTHTRRY